MLICIGSVFSPQELERIQSLLSGQPFKPGSETAGWSASLVKNNQQLSSDAPAYNELQNLISGNLARNEVFTLAVCPKTVSPVIFSQYYPGMSYGTHVDNAIMQGNPPIRADISFTVFLSGPGDYDGGDLVIDEPQGTQEFKLEAGSVIVYPSTTLHRVEEVTRGARVVAVGWVQSMIREPAKREIIFELETVRRRLFEKDGKTAEFDTLSKNVSNLWRRWAEV